MTPKQRVVKSVRFIGVDLLEWIQLGRKYVVTFTDGTSEKRVDKFGARAPKIGTVEAYTPFK